MTDTITNDPINNAIYDGIKRSIRVCLENNCVGAATILIYTGIDTMAYLSMPEKQSDVTKVDFAAWCDKYIRLSGPLQIRGIEYYGARCSMLHSYGIESKLSREGKCRKIGYMIRSIPVIRFDPQIDPDFLLLAIDALAEAFFVGVDRFLIDVFSDPRLSSTVNHRLQNIVVQYATPDAS